MIKLIKYILEKLEDSFATISTYFNKEYSFEIEVLKQNKRSINLMKKIRGNSRKK